MTYIDTIDYDGTDGGFRKYRNGVLHCDDGPALYSPWMLDAKIWFREGRKHKLDGPAAEWSDGSKEWWVEGRLHRLDGPAVMNAGVNHQWWIDGKEYDPMEWLLKVHKLKRP